MNEDMFKNSKYEEILNLENSINNFFADNTHKLLTNKLINAAKEYGVTPDDHVFDRFIKVRIIAQYVQHGITASIIDNKLVFDPAERHTNDLMKILTYLKITRRYRVLGRMYKKYHVKQDVIDRLNNVGNGKYIITVSSNLYNDSMKLSYGDSDSSLYKLVSITGGMIQLKGNSHYGMTELAKPIDVPIPTKEQVEAFLDK